MQGVGEPAATGSSTLNLANHFLIAMPAMQDPVFGGTVVYVCEHNENGVLGVVINKPTDMTMEVLFDRIDLKLAAGSDTPIINEPIMFGGPVQDDRGFVLHTPGAHYSSSLTVTDEIAFTTSIDVLEAVAKGDGPERMLVSIGYSGWSPGQIEHELRENAWLTAPASTSVLFETPLDERWQASAALVVVNLAQISPYAGNA